MTFGALPGPVPASPPEATTYVIDHLIFGSGAARVSSTRFEAAMTFGQSGPSGAASFCNAGFVSGLGFWSVLGESPVENVLTLAGDRTGDVDLRWSGSAPRFEVYRGTAAATIFDPANLLVTTTSCSAADADPPNTRIVFYNVIPAGT
jgi:hypothetical protein